MAAAGDLALIGYSTDTGAAGTTYKTFAFVLLADLSGQTISFTDNGWLAAGGFRSGEGTIGYTVPDGTAIGTVVTLSAVQGNFNLAVAGDSIIAYVGTAASPTNLFALDFADGDSTFEATASNSNSSAVPAGLVFGQTALALPLDNGAYAGPTAGTRAELLAQIADPANWTLSDSAAPTYAAGFSVAAGGSPGSFAIADASVVEGNDGTAPIAFLVTRSGGSSGAADVGYTISFPGSADASDLAGGTALAGTVHFEDGQTSTTITLSVQGETAYEPNETFAVTLTGTTNGMIGTATATGTIVNDDAAPAGTLSIADAATVEGDGGADAITFTVTRTDGAVGAITADYAVAFTGTADAADLTGPTTGTISFADGQTSAQISILVASDTAFEPNETFAVMLSNATGGATIAAATATGTIINDDPVPPLAPVFINELHYDNIGTDSGEAIELAGPAGTSLAGWQLVLYNGDGGRAYTTTPLSGTIADQQNGYGTAVVTYPVNGIQNGSPDGVALVAPDGTVVQFLSYEGMMTAVDGPAAGLTSSDIGVSENSVTTGFSLQLAGTGANYADFTWAQAQQNTFGQINTGENFLPADGPSYIRIGDASVAEGDSGTHPLTFTITRSGGSAYAASVDWFLSLTGSADANDIAPSTPLSGTISFAAGETVKTIIVDALGDTISEPNETLTIRLANPTNASATYQTFISDDVGVGTILNDDPLDLAIYNIQGAGHVSAYVGQRVTTTGIVTAIGTAGFYVQDPIGDGNAATSDAIFVATTGRAAGIAIGDAVGVSGTIGEIGATGGLTVTQFALGAAITVESHGNAVPAAVLIGVDGVLPPTNVIDDDRLTSYDPKTDGIDFYESLEGMRVTVETPLVVARTDSGETWVVASDGQGATGINAHGGITISAGDYNPERILLDSVPDIYSGFTGSYAQGDLLANVTGVLTYNTGDYKLEVTGPAAQLRDADLQPEVTGLVGDASHLTIASFNMENADPGDGAVKFDLIAQTIVYSLRAPDIVMAQEIQDADGAGGGTDFSGQATANAVINAVLAGGGPHYAYVEVAPTANNSTGGEPNGNIRNGFFYNVDRVGYVAGSAALINDAVYEGTRRPLVADFTFNGYTVTAIDIHSTSRLGSTDLFGATQPPIDAGDSARTAQADVVKSYVDYILADDPSHNIVVGGDFNGFYFEKALTDLGSNGLTNLTYKLPVEERYSYVFDGNLQQIDNLLTTDALYHDAEFDTVHINTLKAAGAAMATDHDQVITRLLLPAAGLTYNGGAGDDAYMGGVGDDRLYGNAGNDALHGGAGADFLSGGIGDDVLDGDSGSDILLGGAGADTLRGGDGDDYLSGEAGNDLLLGGAGADTFAFGPLGGRDTIGDFDAARDRILLASGVSLQGAQVADVNHDGVGDLALSFSGGTATVLLDVADLALVHIDSSPEPLITQLPF